MTKIELISGQNRWPSYDCMFFNNLIIFLVLALVAIGFVLYNSFNPPATCL